MKVESSGELEDLLEALAKELWPVTNTAVHNPRVDKVEVVGGPGPGLLGIVDFELGEQGQRRVEVY